jgi:hypothetical protein
MASLTEASVNLKAQQLRLRSGNNLTSSQAKLQDQYVGGGPRAVGALLQLYGAEVSPRAEYVVYYSN